MAAAISNASADATAELSKKKSFTRTRDGAALHMTAKAEQTGTERPALSPATTTSRSTRQLPWRAARYSTVQHQ